MGMNSNQGNSQSNRGDFISMGSGGSRNSCNSRKCTQGQRTKNRIRNRRRNRQGNQQRFQNNRINNMRSGNQNQNRSSKISTNCFDWLAW